MIEPIDSAADPRLAPYARVGDHEWLRATDRFVAEGRLVVQRLIDAGRPAIESILVTPAAHRALARVLDPCAAPVLVCSQTILNGVTGFNFHRGCLAIARRPARPSTDIWLDRDGVLLALDGVGNPDNVGGLFRTAAALGAGGVLVGPGTGDPFYRKAVRTSMGAVLHVPWTVVESWPAVLSELRGHGHRIVALTPRSSATALGDFAGRDQKRLVLMLGAEGSGLADEALALADDRVRIPIAAGVDSLNVVVAAGIALHAVGRIR